MTLQWASRLVDIASVDSVFLIVLAFVILLNTASVLFALLTLHLRRSNERKAERWRHLQESWEPKILEVLSGAEAPESIHALVSEADSGHFLSFLVMYARSLRGQEQEIVRDLARPYLMHLLPELKSATAESRARAVQTLSSLGMPEYAGVVAGALHDPSPLVAMIASRSLFRVGLEEFFPRVLEQLPRFTLWSRSFLASMLAEGGPAALPLLRDLLGDRQQPALVRATVMDALLALNDVLSVDLAVRTLETETDPELTKGALKLIARFGKREHLSLARSLTTSSDPVARSAAASTLGALGGEEEVSRLESMLGDPSAWVSLAAARSLMSLGEREVLERIAGDQSRAGMVATEMLAE